MRFRSGEKPLYKELNTSGQRKYPIPVNLDTPAHKVSILIQSFLGGVEFPTGKDNYAKHRVQYNNDVSQVLQTVNRMIRCIIDCQLYLEDSTAALHALSLSRSLAARVWDDSPLQMKQVEGIGVVFVRKLAMAGIRSLEDLESTEASRIEMILSRNPPFGTKILANLKNFPRLHVTIKMMGQPVSRSDGCRCLNLAGISAGYQIRRLHPR